MSKDEAIVAEIESIGRMVRHCVSRGFPLDEESLVMDIWLELWEKGQHPCWTHVRNRSIDAIRRATVRGTVALDALENLDTLPELEAPLSTVPTLDVQELVNKLMECPTLSMVQRDSIYRRFYLGESLGEIAQAHKSTPTFEDITINNSLREIRAWGENSLDSDTLAEVKGKEV